jgi:tRNA-specific 2-thiouridylase
MLHKKNKVFVALSGGVDSAVAAAILKEKKYQVSGVFMNLIPKKKEFSEARKKFQKAEKNAREIAKTLKIPFFVLDLSAEFEKQVINSFLNEFKKNKTPNPCVVCNQKIRFDIFLKKMRKKGADFIATGHYIKKTKNKPCLPAGRKQKTKIFYKLFQAEDKEKDQSYFLYNLKQNQLKRVLFPLGDLTKKEVRKLAKKFNLPVQDQPESQEICFVADKNISAFLSRHLKTKPGNIITVDGKKIGKHQGLFFYTIGQRREIGIGGTGPYNWISGKEPELLPAYRQAGLKIKVKTRYRQEIAEAILIKNNKQTLPTGRQRTKNKNYKIKFKTPQRAITSGQSVVFYLQNNELLGGGIIA